MKKPVTKCIWIRHAPSWRPEGHVPAHDPDIVPDRASADALARMLPDAAHWLISPLKRCQQTAAQLEQTLTRMGRPCAAQKTITNEIIEQDLGQWAGAKLDNVWAELQSAPRHNFSFQTPVIRFQTFQSRPWHICHHIQFLLNFVWNSRKVGMAFQTKAFSL